MVKKNLWQSLFLINYLFEPQGFEQINFVKQLAIGL